MSRNVWRFNLVCPLLGCSSFSALLLALRYGAEQGQGPLREALAKTFYPNRVADEIFVSDGSKCDIARIQMMFGAKATVAVQV